MRNYILKLNIESTNYVDFLCDISDEIYSIFEAEIKVNSPVKAKINLFTIIEANNKSVNPIKTLSSLLRESAFVHGIEVQRTELPLVL